MIASTTSLLPFMMAITSALCPALFLWVREAPFLMSNMARCSWPLIAAKWSGVVFVYMRWSMRNEVKINSHSNEKVAENGPTLSTGSTVAPASSSILAHFGLP